MNWEQFGLAVIMICVLLLLLWPVYIKMSQKTGSKISNQDNLLITRFLLYLLASLVTFVVMVIVKFF